MVRRTKRWSDTFIHCLLTVAVQMADRHDFTNVTANACTRLSTGRPFLNVNFVTILTRNLCTALTGRKTTENINSHAQEKNLHVTPSVTYLLTPWSRVLLKKLTGLQLVKKFPAYYRTRKFLTALTSERHLPLSWASSTQSTHPHSTSRRSILILSSHLRLGLPSFLLPSCFHTKPLYTLLPPHTRYMPRPSHPLT